MSPSFVHLHCHSEFSLVDSTLRIDEMIQQCCALGLPAIAINDNCNMFALVKFFKAAEAKGIKPIAGADLFLAEPNQPPSRLTFLCQNQAGYLSLSRLISRAYLEGHRGDFVSIQADWLQHDNEGLILIVGRESLLGQHIASGKNEHVKQTLSEWQQLFEDRLYIEITRTGRDGEQDFNAAAISLAAEYDLPLLASNDVRFLEREDFDAHEARVCIATGRVLDDPKRPRDYSREQYLKSPEEMQELFSDIPEALQNTVELAKRCNYELNLGTYYLPQFPVPDGHTLDSWIRETSHLGLKKRLAKQDPAPGHTVADYEQRLDIELGVISTLR